VRKENIMTRTATREEQSLPPKEFLSPVEVEAVFGIPKATQAKMRWNETGPDFAKLGSRVVYRRSDVYAWIAANTRGNQK
jgi:predicted DNA-binding transcriptional regulator AlpA